MKNNKKKNIDKEEDDYIIDNEQEFEDFENNNQNYGYNANNNKKIKNNNYTNDMSADKEQNNLKINKNKKTSPRAGEWIKEAKAKYQQEKNNKSNNINKTDSRVKTKKIVNYDEIPVGGGMGNGANFNIEIKVPSKAKKLNENKSNNNKDNYENNIGHDKEIYLKKKLDNKINTKKENLKNTDKNGYYDDNNINNNDEQVEMERKNSLVSMITQTCDKEMVGRSEFIGIPLNQNNLNPNISREINLDPNLFRLTEGRQTFSMYDKNDNLISNKNITFKDHLDTSNFSSINKLTEFSTTQNLREKTENAIQLQNVQRELDNEIEMNKRLQGQIENYKSEFNNLREELVKKSDTINELQQKISKLEKDLFLQGNQLIEAEAKPSQEHYEDIVNNYDELKRNFDKAIERIKYLSDENAELIEKNLRLEENNKKLRKELKLNKEKNLYMGDNKNKNKNIKYNNNLENDEENDYYYEENDYKENDEDIDDEIEYNNEISNKKYGNNNNYNKKKNKNVDASKAKSSKNISEKNVKEEQSTNTNIEDKKETNEKRSIIPEDNDIFGTRNYSTNQRNAQKPRKIQEDGIPVIKRVEEKDNVKDIMVNNYATNDDDYYNRPPVGKPKARRIKRNTNNQNTNSNTKNNNNYENINNNIETKSKNTSMQEVEKDNNEFKENDKNDDIDQEEEEIKYNNKYNYKNNFRIFSNNNKDNKNQRSSFGTGITTSVGVFPSQLKVIANEREILNLESKLFNLQKERDLINDEYLKFPEHPKKREEINAKRKIEIQLEEMNKEISSQKLKIRELKEQKK